MKTSFNINRFCQLLKWNITTDEPSFIKKIIFGVAGFMLIQLFFCFTLSDLTASKGEFFTLTAVRTCAGLGMIFTLYFASGILGNARTKEQRNTVLMLPASNLEKYSARFAYCVVVLPLLTIGCIILGTGLRMLLELAMGHDAIYCGLSALYSLETIHSLILDFWLLSLFVLGGLLFKKNPFLWTWATLLIVMIAFAMIAVLTIKATYTGNGRVSFDGSWVFDIVFVCLAVFNIWFSYRLYQRLQVVQHKWFNL